MGVPLGRAKIEHGVGATGVRALPDNPPQAINSASDAAIIKSRRMPTSVNERPLFGASASNTGAFVSATAVLEPAARICEYPTSH